MANLNVNGYGRASYYEGPYGQEAPIATTGTSISANDGTASISINAPVSLTGVGLLSALSSVVATGAAQTYPSGMAVTANIASVEAFFRWKGTIPTQNPAYAVGEPTQTPGYSTVTPSQDASWSEVNG